MMPKKPLLLLVDDDAAFRTVMAAELARSGYDVRTAASGEEALAASAEAEPQVVLLDLQLPDMSGLDVLKALRESQRRAEVVMLTGHGSIDTAIESSVSARSTTSPSPARSTSSKLRIQRALERRSLQRPRQPAGARTRASGSRSRLRGRKPRFRGLVQLIERVAPADSTVLDHG